MITELAPAIKALEDQLEIKRKHHEETMASKQPDSIKELIKNRHMIEVLSIILGIEILQNHRPNGT